MVDVIVHASNSIAKDIQVCYCQEASILYFGITQTRGSKICPGGGSRCRSVVNLCTQIPICISKRHATLPNYCGYSIHCCKHACTYVTMQLHTIITLIRLVSNCLERPCVLTCLEAAQDKSRRVAQDTGLSIYGERRRYFVGRQHMTSFFSNSRGGQMPPLPPPADAHETNSWVCDKYVESTSR